MQGWARLQPANRRAVWAGGHGPSRASRSITGNRCRAPLAKCYTDTTEYVRVISLESYCKMKVGRDTET